ncbi:unnamed protein product [marine sediment metagenome]|uniref:Uncharacterized protein n=1 Tax=marine sediment metagenome TaxID=412755 RepID=X1MBG2_9ZZZZ
MKLSLEWDGIKIPPLMVQDIKNQMPKELKDKIEKCKDIHELDNMEEWNDFMGDYIYDMESKSEVSILSEEEANFWIEWREASGVDHLQILGREDNFAGKVLVTIIWSNCDYDYPVYDSLIYVKEKES